MPPSVATATSEDDHDHFEAEPDGEAGVVVRNLKKVFHNFRSEFSNENFLRLSRKILDKLKHQIPQI